MVCSHWWNANAKVWNVCYFSLVTSILGLFDSVGTILKALFTLSNWGYDFYNMKTNVKAISLNMCETISIVHSPVKAKNTKGNIVFRIRFALKSSLRSIYTCGWRLRGDYERDCVDDHEIFYIEWIGMVINLAEMGIMGYLHPRLVELSLLRLCEQLLSLGWRVV